MRAKHTRHSTVSTENDRHGFELQAGCPSSWLCLVSHGLHTGSRHRTLPPSKPLHSPEEQKAQKPATYLHWRNLVILSRTSLWKGILWIRSAVDFWYVIGLFDTVGRRAKPNKFRCQKFSWSLWIRRVLPFLGGLLSSRHFGFQTETFLPTNTSEPSQRSSRG